jgi:hypothetical protein
LINASGSNTGSEGSKIILNLSCFPRYEKI